VKHKISKYLERIGIALSVLLNVILGGPSNQTFSARNWGWKLAGKPNLVWLIDFIFSLYEEDHCQISWRYWAYNIKKLGETKYEYYDYSKEGKYD